MIENTSMDKFAIEYHNTRPTKTKMPNYEKKKIARKLSKCVSIFLKMQYFFFVIAVKEGKFVFISQVNNCLILVFMGPRKDVIFL